MEKLRVYLNQLSVDEQRAFALACNTTIGYLRKAISARQLLGAEYCIAIERQSNRRVICEDMRPDIPWGYLRNTKIGSIEQIAA